MADNYLITGYWGEPHVTAENDRGINAAVFGAGKFVLPVGEMFRAEYIGNNTVRIHDGKLIDNGAAAGIPAGKYIDLLIPEAGQGMNRNDLIIFQYSQDSSTLIESGVFTVLSGAEVNGDATDPMLHEEDLLTDEATFDQMALWRVPVSGANISSPEQLFKVSRSIPDIKITSANILDNSDFTNPFNQRGETSYTGAKYGIDRWTSRSGYCTVTIAEDCVNIKSTNGTTAAYVLQFIESGKIKSGKKYTAACQLKDGSIHTITAEASVDMTEATRYIYVDGEQLGTIRFRYDSTEKLYAVMLSTLSTSGMNIVNVALYEGEYTVDNLPVYQPKGYGAELLECFRYFVRIENKHTSNKYYLGTAFATATSMAVLTIKLPASMRIPGSLQSKNVEISESSSAKATVVDTVGVIATPAPNITRNISLSGTFTIGSTYTVWLAAGGYIELSADL